MEDRPILIFTTEVPPSVNHAYVRTRYGGRVLSAKAKAWQRKAQRVAIDAVKHFDWKLVENEQVVVEIDTWFGDRRRRDCHNGAKVMLDTFENIIYKDDKIVLPRYMTVQLDRENPRCRLKFYLKRDEDFFLSERLESHAILEQRQKKKRKKKSS